MIADNQFPWQKKQWQQLWQSYQQNRLPHALLFSGIAGIGKMHMAILFAHSLLCSQPNDTGDVCGQCRSCHLINAKSHADLLVVEPEESGQMIKIDQIREVIEFVNSSAQQGGYRIIIINPANAMNQNAANALLKSLEEPTARCLLILVSNKRLKLLPTIKSRCQEIAFQKPEHEMGVKWLIEKNNQIPNAELLLSLANGAPLKALDLFETNFITVRQDFYNGLLAISQKQEDPLRFAARWLETEIATLMSLLQNWLRDLLRFKLTQGEGAIINFDFRDAFTKISQRLALNSMMEYIDYVQNHSLKVLDSNNLNRQLVLEELFIQWARVN